MSAIVSRAVRTSWCRNRNWRMACRHLRPGRGCCRPSQARGAPPRQTRRGSRTTPPPRVPCPRSARRSRHRGRWLTAGTSPRWTAAEGRGAPGPPTLKKPRAQQRVNMVLSDFTRSTRLFALFSFSLLYTGSSRHRVARLSTLFHIFTSLSLSLPLALPFSFFFLFPSVSFPRLSSIRILHRPSPSSPSLHRTGYTSFFHGLLSLSLEFRYLADARPSGWCVMCVHRTNRALYRFICCIYFWIFFWYKNTITERKRKIMKKEEVRETDCLIIFLAMP